MEKLKILVTGAAGFIGYHLCTKLLGFGHRVVGLDNINDYYDVNLKYARLNQLGVSKEHADNFANTPSNSVSINGFSFIRMNLEDSDTLSSLFKEEKFDVVCNLAAQVGVRYSIKNPKAYIQSNVVGYLNILECCKNHEIKHLVYASSSSVYGLNKKIPFSTTDSVDKPISVYAASKKSNELLAHTYSHIYGLNTTGLRFFTVYGPWGRPDMATFKFTRAILNDEPIQVFNHGNMKRDFTYVDDIVEGIFRVLTTKPKRKKGDSYRLYNIGNNNSINLLDFIKEIEKNIGKESKKQLLPLQDGDVENTWANVDGLAKEYGYRPSTSIEEGVAKFIKWYNRFYR